MGKTLAQNLGIGSYSIEGPVPQFTNIGSIVGKSLTYVFAFAGVGLLLMIIASGFGMMLSAGDPKKLQMARGRLTNAIVGFLLVFAAFWIVQAAGTIFGWESIIQIFGQ
jgi:hypothetical protein